MDKEKERKKERKYSLLGPAWPEDGQMDDEQDFKTDYNPLAGEPYENNLSALLAQDNIAVDLDRETLEEISSRCKEGFENDLESREDWERDIDEWTKLAMQCREQRSWPWRDASNVKYPLLSTAAMQFAARAYPSLIPSDGKVVKSRIIGKDETGAKGQKAERISTFMSYQVMNDMDQWEEDMDKMLMMLPIVGTMFKKTYFDPADKKIKSTLVMPKNLVVNNWAGSLESAERVSEILTMSARIVEERKRQGIFLNRDLGQPSNAALNMNSAASADNTYAKNDETTPYELIEQHTYLDLDDDGYEEPYIVTFERNTGNVLRIVARWEEEGVEEFNDEIIRIKPTQHYTKYSFVPNPDGSFYSIGFGVLLGPINEAVNSLINQLIDSGTINNLQSGWIGKGLRIKTGESRFQPGEWKPVNATGDDLRKQIVPLPSKEPSSVLFQLMGSLVTSGKELASVAEIFVGKMPGQNTPATTTMASIEQGMKVFTAVYKRIYRSLESEFKKIFQLNGIYLNPETYVAVLDTPVGPDDFVAEGWDVCPGADPTAVSQTERLLKAQGLMELMAAAPNVFNPIEIFSRVLQAQEQPNWQAVFSQEVQQSGQIPETPDPKMMEMQMKMEAEQGKAQLNMQQAEHKMALESQSQETQLAMKEQEANLNAQAQQQKIMFDAAAAEHKQRIFMTDGALKIGQKAAEGEQKLQQMRSEARTRPNKTSKSGSGNK